MLGLTAVALVFAASNADEYSRWSSFNEQSPLVEAPPGCEIEYYPNNDPQKVTAETPHQGARSAARDFQPSSLDLPALVRQSREYMSLERQHFVMSQSGIEVAIHAPDNVQVNERVFAELFHAPLLLDREYTHPEVRQLVDCYRRDIIERQAFAGTVYHVFVAPEAGYCIRHGRFQPSAEVERCDGKGFTPPELELEFAGLNVLNFYMMMLSTGRTDGPAGKAISGTLAHESIHAFMSLSGQPLRLDPDERLVKQIQAVVLRHRYPAGVPTAISYPQTN